MTEKAPRAASGQRKKPHPLLSPPVLVTAGLTVLLLELVVWVAVGPLWWPAINLLLLAALAAPVVWFVRWLKRTTTPAAAGSRSTPTRGPLGRLTGRAAAGPGPGRSGAPAGRGKGTSGGGRLGRLLGRSSGKSGGSESGRGGLLGRSRTGGTAGSGRRGGLGRLLSAGRRSGGSGPAARSGSGRTGRTGSALRGLLSGGKRSAAGRSGSGLRSLLGGRKSTIGRSGGTAGRTAAASGARRGGPVSRMRSAGRGLLGRAVGRPSGTKRPTSASSAGRSSKSRPGQSGIAKFLKGVREGAAAGRKPSSKPARAAAKPEPVEPGTRYRCPICRTPPGGPWCEHLEQKLATLQHTAQRKLDEWAAQSAAKSTPQQRATPKENRTMVQHQDDVSLQRWGRNLTSVSPAIEELAKQADSQGQLAGAVATAVGKLASQGDDELPAAKTVTAEAAAIASELKQVEAEQAAAAQKLRSLMGRADALGASYRRNHETDEARLAGERGGRHKEKRADVGHAEQDT